MGKPYSMDLREPVRNPLRGDNSVLGEMPPQGVDGLGALANQHVAGPEELSIAAPSV